MLGGSTFSILPTEVRHDPTFGSPGPKHWVIPQTAMRDISCEKKLLNYTLRFLTDTGVYEAAGFPEDDVLQVVSIIMPQKLQTDPVLLGIQQQRAEKARQEQQRQVDKAFQAQQRAYEKQLAAYQQSLQPEQLVRTYKHNPEKDFQNDAKRLARDGWVIQSQTSGGTKRIGAASLVTFGLAGGRRVGEITAVYSRPRRPLPMPTPPAPPAPVPPVASLPTPAPTTPFPAPPASAPEPQPVQPPAPAPAAEQPDLMAQLEKLGELHAKGILTDEEFAAKKADILARL